MSLRKLTGMTPAKIRMLRPEDVNRKLNPGEIEVMIRACDAIWLHSDKPTDPHAILASGNHSDGFILMKDVLAYPNLRMILARQLVLKLEEQVDVNEVGAVVGSATSATDLARDVASILGVPWIEMRKNGEDQEVVGDVPPGKSILQVEELITTTLSSNKVRTAIRAKDPNATFVHYLPVIVYRPEDDGHALVERSLLLPLYKRIVHNWAPDACPLCQGGSTAIKPKLGNNWAIITGRASLAQAPAIISRAISFQERLGARIELVGSQVCVGLDPDQDKLEPDERDDPNRVFKRMLEVVERTESSAAVFKPNLAFWECIGGHEQLRSLIKIIRGQGAQVIVDGKFGDIGPTAKHYALKAFGWYGADAATVNAYLGTDTLDPWLAWGPAYAIYVLWHTSNPGASEFQELTVCPPVDGLTAAFLAERSVSSDVAKRERALFVEIAEKSRAKQTPDTAAVGGVMGATYPKQLDQLELIPDLTNLLLPGVGKQGGEVREVMQRVRRLQAVVNSSGAICHAGKGPDHAIAAGLSAAKTRNQINAALAA